MNKSALLELASREPPPLVYTFRSARAEYERIQRYFAWEIWNSPALRALAKEKGE